MKGITSPVVGAETKRSTIYFDPELHQALRVKSAEISRSVSELVNDAVRELLTEDAEDLAGNSVSDRGVPSLIDYASLVI